MTAGRHLFVAVVFSAINILALFKLTPRRTRPPPSKVCVCEKRPEIVLHNCEGVGNCQYVETTMFSEWPHLIPEIHQLE